MDMKYGAVSIDPETVSGTPVFVGTRVFIETLFDYLEGGETLEEFLENFPSVSRKKALQALEMAKTAIITKEILNANFISH